MSSETSQDLPDTTEQDEDVIIDSNLKINKVNEDLNRATIPASNVELMDKPGYGVTIGGRDIPIPRAPRKRKGIGTQEDKGRPAHEPTDPYRQYVFDACMEGYTLRGIAHNLRIGYATLMKYYSYEIEQAEEAKDRVMDGVLYRNARRSEINPAYQRSAEFYYKRHGKVKDQLDITSNGESMDSVIAIVMPAVDSGQEKGELD